MKKILIIFAILISLIGGASKFIYDKIDSLKSDLLHVKNANTNLKSELLQVKHTNTNLKSENKNLVTKENDIKKKLKDRRIKLAKKKLSRAKHKIGKAAIGVMPFVGTAAVSGLTYTEIQGYCDDLKEYREFEKSIFNDTNINKLQEEQLLCGFERDVIEKEVYKDLDEFKNELSSIFVIQYNSFSTYIENEYKSYIEEKD